jgi:hypothetical protein
MNADFLESKGEQEGIDMIYMINKRLKTIM